MRSQGFYLSAELLAQEVFDCVHAAGSESRHVVNALRAFWKFGVNRGMVARNVTAGGFQLPTRTAKPQPTSAEMLEIIEDHLGSLESRGRRTDLTLLLDVWRVMRSTGARIGEALALQVQDINWNTREVKLAQRHFAKIASARGRTTDGILPGGKTAASERTIVVSPRTLDGLRVRCTDMKGDPETWSLRAGHRFVFETDQHRPVTPSSYRSRLRRELLKLKLGREVTPHDLRDTAATAICRALVERHGVHAGLSEAARFLGHKGVTKALLAYVDDSATTVDQSEIIETLDPRARRDAARQAIVDALARGFTFSQTSRLLEDVFSVAVLAEDVDQMRAAAAGLDFTLLVDVLHPEAIEF